MKKQLALHQQSVLIKSIMFKIIIFLCSLFFPIWGMATVPIPAYTSPVVDLTQTLSPEQQQTLITQMAQLEQKQQGAQLAILMLPTTDGESIESFASRVFEQWKIGRKNKDNGLLIVIAKQDHTVRIEVGYGFEGNITDVMAGRIIRQVMIPYFQKENYFGALMATTDRLTTLIDQETQPEEVESDWEGYISEFLFMTVYVSGILYVLFSKVNVNRQRQSLSHKLDANKSKKHPKLTGKMRFMHYLMSVFGVNTIMYMSESSHMVSMTPIVMILTALASFASCGIASLFLTQLIRPGTSIRPARGRWNNPHDRFGGGGFGGFGGGGGGGGGRSGGGGASGRW